MKLMFESIMFYHYLIRDFSEIHTHSSPCFLLYAIDNWNQERFSFNMVNWHVPGVDLRCDALSLMSSLSTFEFGPCFLSRIKWRCIWCCKGRNVFTTCKGQGETPSTCKSKWIILSKSLPGAESVEAGSLMPVRVWLVPDLKTLQPL